MNSAIERLLSLRVRDVMHSDVITVESSATMGQAAAKLSKYEITGAPVVNDAGKCVGVLSASDFALRAAERPVPSKSFELGFETIMVKKTAAAIDAASVDSDLVADHMSPVVQTISQDAPIMNAARVLTGEHIHRLVIVDDGKRPTGVLTALDLVACLVGVIEE